MMKLKDGNDVAVYLRNQLLAMMEISREYGLHISMFSTSDGAFGNVIFDDWVITEYANDGDIGTAEYYEHKGHDARNRTYIQPRDVKLEKRPDAVQSDQGTKK